MGQSARFGKIDGNPFEHTAHNGVRLTADRCDFANGVTVTRPETANDAKFAAGIAECFAFHAIHILPDLTSFMGYGAFRIKVVDEGKYAPPEGHKIKVNIDSMVNFYDTTEEAIDAIVSNGIGNTDNIEVTEVRVVNGHGPNDEHVRGLAIQWGAEIVTND